MIVEAARRLVREFRDRIWGPDGHCLFCGVGRNPHGGGKVHGPLCPWVDLVDAVDGTFGETELGVVISDLQRGKAEELTARAVGDIEPASPEQAA